MSRVVVDPTKLADRAIGAVRGLVGMADQPAHEETAHPGRWLAVTV
jgi:hypothetical protein